MPKQMSCSKTIGRAIRKFGLTAVESAVEMAVELSDGPEIKAKSVTKKATAERKFTQSLGLTPTSDALERAATKD